MKKFPGVLWQFSLLIIAAWLYPSISFAQKKIAKNQLEYHFSWDGNSSILKVDLFYITKNADSSVFNLETQIPVV